VRVSERQWRSGSGWGKGGHHAVRRSAQYTAIITPQYTLHHHHTATTRSGLPPRGMRLTTNTRHASHHRHAACVARHASHHHHEACVTRHASHLEMVVILAVAPV
jgi:hypothetical protein